MAGKVTPFAGTRMFLLPVSSLLTITPFKEHSNSWEKLNVQHSNSKVIEKRAIIKDWKYIVLCIKIFLIQCGGEVWMKVCGIMAKT